MIAKTSVGGSFGGALAYGAGERESVAEKPKPSQLLGASNLLSRDPAGMAREMQAVADGSRCKTPVWHTSLSWPKGQELDERKLRQAAAEYCVGIGADPRRHQVAIYQHFDKAHPHLHIYINRVPLDGGPALDTSHNYARNVKVCEQIRQKLGFAELPKERQSLRDHDLKKQSTREYVAETLRTALETTNVVSVNDLRDELEKKGVESIFKYDSQARLVGCSFRYNQVAVKGTEVGYKAAQVAGRLQRNEQAQDQSQAAWDALFSGYAAASAVKEAEKMDELLKGYSQAAAQEQQRSQKTELAPKSEEIKQQPKQSRGPKL
ncbi:relaxase [Siphonobacter sp. BAB-5405]|uniref:relaxase/mobilization nuclease domain-containing protein n=1 Tax=Siphonobacter sp. BAB-5405 TaxID=1864825 RepID=UPI000C80B9C1|nr:relaxase/mobilization nuclease domain-containing protein [Siphonobacter sp. BAB-5405]PMD91931.1 relaxase [Siphonobacter sp. BAB-5405]